MRKDYESASLGVDVEGIFDEDYPRHIVRSVAEDGPIGAQTSIKEGDEILEVNGETLVGMDHLSAVNIIRGLPEHVVLVCARLRGNHLEPEPESILESVTEVPKIGDSSDSDSQSSNVTPPEVVVPIYDQNKSMTNR